MESFADVFLHVKEQCSTQITEVSYNLWIKPIEPLNFDKDTAVLFVKDDFHKGILTDKYLTLLTKSFEEVMGYPIEVKILSEKDTGTPDETYTQNNVDEDGEPQTMSYDCFDKKYEYTFDTFIVGKSNEFAHAACRAVAQNKVTEYNPLFIHGPSGLGKTHLMISIKNYVKQHSPEKNIVFVNSETFTNELVKAIHNKTINDLHAKYRKADILLLDDVQFIAGKESTQEEFFHTFNELYQAGKQIILTSDRPPKDIKTLEERLRNRFESGLMADISYPDYETRLAIIERKAEIIDLQLPKDVAAYIAKKLKSDIRQLEGTVNKLKANKLFTGAPPSIAVAQNVIRDVLNDNQPEPVTVEKIITEVGKTFSVTPEEIRSKKRNAQISVARQTAIYIIRQITQMSLDAIGKEFNGRDHSTVSLTLSKVEQKMKTDKHYSELIEDTIKNIKAKE